VVRFINVLELGYQNNSSKQQPNQTGYEIRLEIPLFDWSGAARLARAEASTLKVRRGHKPGDYSDPGWYKQPKGTQACEWAGALPDPARAADRPSPENTELKVRKPADHHRH
jgi:hypothetical protein